MANFSSTRNLRILARNLFSSRPQYHFKIPNHRITSQYVRNFHISPFLQKIVSFKLSDIGEGIREVTVKEWFVKVGDTVEQFQELCEVQSDKASVTITSRYDGKIVKIYHNVDGIALVGKPLVDFDVEDDDDNDDGDNKNEDADKSSSSDSESDTDRETEKSQEKESSAGRVRVIATPAVRRIAMENKVILGDVQGTGRDGRVLKGDVLEYLGRVPAGTNIPHPTIEMMKTDKAPTIKHAPTDRVEPLKGVKKAMFKSMTETLKIPHFGYSEEIDMTQLIDFRNHLRNEALIRPAGKLTFMPFCIKAASIALSSFPILNSSIEIQTESVVYKSSHNISIAIDTPPGLVVPNIKDCQKKSILQITKELNDLIERAQKGALTPADFANGTFSLSNIGNIGGTYTHPCILPPQVAIGAMGRTNVLPRFGPNGEIIKAHIMRVSWSADHRVIDGVTVAKFSNLWKKYLENPALFLLE